MLDFLWFPAVCYMLLRHELRLYRLEKRTKCRNDEDGAKKKDDLWERYESTRPK